MISILFERVNKYPEDNEFRRDLEDAYKKLGDPQIAINGWDQLSKNHPESSQVAERLSRAYVNCQDPLKMIPGFIGLLDRQPENIDFQNQLSQAYERLHDPYQSIEGWKRLVKRHPKSCTLVNCLSQSLDTIDDADIAMAIWWEILKANPVQLPILREFWDACGRRRRQRHKFKTPALNIIHFTWLCALNYISDECLKYGIEDIDWWPLAMEDDIMDLRPYMVKREWFCVEFLLRLLAEYI